MTVRYFIRLFLVMIVVVVGFLMVCCLRVLVLRVVALRIVVIVLRDMMMPVRCVCVMLIPFGSYLDRATFVKHVFGRRQSRLRDGGSGD